LPFFAGNWTFVIEKKNADIWKGTLNGRTGFFPSSMVECCDEDLSREFTGGLYYDLAAILLEVTLKRSLSVELEQLLAKTLSGKGLNVLLSRLDTLITKAANTVR
jgi:hypothetical protein